MKTCERCGQSFGCDSNNKDKKCWCMNLAIAPAMPLQYKDCLCSACLNDLSLTKQNGDLIEGEDFYLEKGLLVFTEKYHLNKGYCCGNGCRHCPY